MRILVQEAPFELGAESDAFAAGVAGAGAVVTFTGVVRDADQGGLQAMEIEHYPGMTEKAMTAIVEEACKRWSLADALVIHRHGPLAPGETIMMVATAAGHRAEAFAAADFLMDYLKSRAPFWKKEHGEDSSHWVEARKSDGAATEKWQRR